MTESDLNGRWIDSSCHRDPQEMDPIIFRWQFLFSSFYFSERRNLSSDKNEIQFPVRGFRSSLGVKSRKG
jgi:hypothetical protein